MDRTIDHQIFQSIFSKDEGTKKNARQTIRKTADEKGILPSSLFTLYKAIGRREIDRQLTVPAINIRTLTYDTARIIFKLMHKHQIGPVIFEIAKSEMGYTDQTPDEYAVSIISAALKENYKGPVFIQGDHFQLNKDHFENHKGREIHTVEVLIKESIDAQFYNIDIDASTLVDLKQPTAEKQQELNSEITAHFTSFIRNLQPPDITVAVGGEIGHIGGVNSTTQDFRAFMNQYLAQIQTDGISKVSIQTGSSHGGTVMPDGTVKKVSIDFSTLDAIGQLAKNKYGLGGAVQHGASTLPLELFDTFPKNNTVEIHLATGFQNSVYTHMPEKLKEEMYSYVKNHFSNERVDGQSDEQFLYKLRKKALGPFKKQLWELRSEEKMPILSALGKQFETIFEKLGVYNTRGILNEYYG